MSLRSRRFSSTRRTRWLATATRAALQRRLLYLSRFQAVLWADMSEWTLIESDPGVFTALLEAMGAQGLQVEELWSLDKESLSQLAPVYGVVFLFKWQREEDPRPVEESSDADLFFAQQVITNACATQAILSVVFNAPGLDLGNHLQDLKDFTAGFTPEMKGLAISNAEAIRQAHNSFQRPDPFVPEDDEKDKKGEAFHFISYVPFKGALYELDGLKPGPIKLCSVGSGEDDWLDKIGPIVQERMARYSEKEIRFNLMAVVKDTRVTLREKIEALEGRVRELQGPREGGASTATSAPDAAGAAGRDEEVEMGLSQVVQLKDMLAVEEDKRRRWHDENVRRRHNYVPLIFNLLKAMAERGELAAVAHRARVEKKPNT